MLKKNKKFTAILLGLFLSSTVSSIKPITVSAASNRLSGQDRYETAAAISKEGWTTSDYVVLASGEGYADALCAAPLAKKYNAPILLTESKELNSNAKEEIKRLNAKHIIIVGKYASVSQAAESDLSSIVSDVKRLGGNDRYETSVIVAKELGAVNAVAVTSGYGFADALSIAPIAAEKNMPILLAGKDSLPTVVQDYINENKASISNSYVVGGQGVISDEVAKQLSNSAVRLSGQDRFETNVKVMEYFLKDLKFDNLYVVQANGPTGNEFADALSGTALAVKTSSPVILTYKDLSAATDAFIKANVNTKTSITAIGGVAAVPETIVGTLEGYVSSNGIQQPTTSQTSTAGGGTAVGGGVAAGGSVATGGGAVTSGTTTTTTTTTTTIDGDIELVFSSGVQYDFNINSENAIDISSDFNNNKLTQIKIYSSQERDVNLQLSIFNVPKHLSTGWNDLNVPGDFVSASNNTQGVSQKAFDLVGTDGKFNLTVESSSDSKTVVVTYK